MRGDGKGDVWDWFVLDLDVVLEMVALPRIPYCFALLKSVFRHRWGVIWSRDAPVLRLRSTFWVEYVVPMCSLSCEVLSGV